MNPQEDRDKLTSYMWYFGNWRLLVNEVSLRITEGAAYTIGRSPTEECMETATGVAFLRTRANPSILHCHSATCSIDVVDSKCLVFLVFRTVFGCASRVIHAGTSPHGKIHAQFPEHSQATRVDYAPARYGSE